MKKTTPSSKVAETSPSSEKLTSYFRELGKKGGAAGKGKAKARDPEKMRRAVAARWKKHKPPPATAYKAAKPKQFGNLHERMKWAEDLTHKLWSSNPGMEKIYQQVKHLRELRDAVFDLAVEVQCYDTDKKPRS
jgi:hypothetical protein